MLGFSTLSEAPLSTQPVAEQNTLILPHLSSTSVLYAPTAIPQQLVELPLFTNTSTFYTHSVDIEATLPLLTNTSAFYAPSAAFVGSLPLLTNANTLHEPAVASFTVYLPHMDRGDSLFPMTSSLTPVDLTMPLLSNENELIPFYQVKRQRLIFTGVSYILE